MIHRAMCTVTIIPTGGGLRMACNRDESRTRAAARLPEVRTFGPRRAIMPVDPVSDGTWIAVNDAGLALTLLNAYPRPARELWAAAEALLLSRGLIIPSLLHLDSVAAAVDAVRHLDARQYPPFRLVLMDRGEVADVGCDGRALTVSRIEAPDAPLLYTSSGLGDQLVDAPRRELFIEMLAGAKDSAARQDAFHRHRWPDRPHLSVCMSRPEARTVSLTIVELRPAAVRLVYYPEAPDRPVEPVEAELVLDASAQASSAIR